MQCTFCGHPIAIGTGMMYVKTDGRIFYFCSSKCEKHLLKLKHNPRKSRWTAEHQRLKTAEKAGEGEKKEKPGKDVTQKKTAKQKEQKEE